MHQAFEAPIGPIGSRVGIRLPFDPAVAWGELDRYSVRGTIGGHPWRGKVEWHEGAPYLFVGAAWFRDNPVAPGDEVPVELGLEGHFSFNVAPDIQKVLVGDHAKKFDSLTSFERNNLIRNIESAKRPETRAKRIGELLDQLSH